MPSHPPLPTFHDVRDAAARIQGVARRTPALTARSADELVARFAPGARLHFKCENLQRVGAFKFRGAYNALSRLRESSPGARGVLTFSSGNHAQAVALAGSLLGLPTVIVMPRNAPRVKLEATRAYQAMGAPGSEVVLYEPDEESREALAARLASERGLTVIPPYDHPHVIAGQGTAALELLEEVGPLDMLVVCCGGGGLLTGSALAARAVAPGCRVIGVEPEAGDDAARSFRTKTLQTVRNPDTIADGARTPSLGALTFPLVLQNVDDVITVPDAALVRAMKFFFERMRLVVEPTGCLAAAALFEGVVRPAPGARVGVILSGGNVDLEAAMRLMTGATA